MASTQPSASISDQSVQVHQVVHAILSLLNSDLQRRELFKQVGLSIQPLIPFDRFSISLEQLRFWFYFQDGEVTSERDRGLFDEQSSASTWVFINKQPLLRRDISGENRFEYDPDLSEEPMRSDLILPLIVDSEIIGTFNFTSHDANVYNQTHLDAALPLTDTIATVVKQMQSRRTLRAVQRVQTALLETEDMEAIFDELISHLYVLYDRIRVYLYDPTQNVLKGHIQGGIMKLDNFEGLTFDLDNDPYSRETFKGSHPRIYRTEPPHQRWVEKSIKKGTLEWAEIPLKVNYEGQEIIIGKISLDNVSTRVPLRLSDLERTMIFVSQAALAIHHAQLRDEMSNRVSRQTQALIRSNEILAEKDKLLTAFYGVSRLSLSYLDRDAILDNFGQQIIRAGIFRSLMISLVDHNEQKIEVVRSFQSKGRDSDGNLQIHHYDYTDGTVYNLHDDNITPITARTGELQMITSETDSRLDDKFDELEGKVWNGKIAYFIPVKREDRVMAVLGTGSTQEEKDQILRNIETMEPLLNQLGIALEHANLHAKVQTSNEELQHEIAERTQTELALRESRQQYRSLFDNMVQGFAYHEMVLDNKGNPVDYIFREVNEGFENLTGLKAKDIINKRVTEALPGTEKDPADWIGTYGQVALTGASIAFENYSEALERWFSVTAYSPQKGFFACIFEDVTERKRSEERVSSLMAFQQEMLDTPVVWICAFDYRREITFWNRAAEIISGYTAEEAIGDRSVWEKLYPDDAYLQWIVEESQRRIEQSGKLENFETTVRCKDGTKRTISWQLNTLQPDEPESGYLTIGMDISTNKRMEDELVRMERLKALGELAAGVSHNLNNMLTGILGPAELLKLEVTDSESQINVDDIITSATRARDLVRQLNQVVRRDIPENLEAVDLNTIIAQAIRATSPRWKDEAQSRGIKVSIYTSLSQVPLVSATETGVHDMLLNFIFNAIDAMPLGGDITIETKPMQAGVRLTISDTGIGMNAEIKRRVFEPFFTTKMDVGTGMGLATVHANIERWNAAIDIETAPQAGTTFTIDFKCSTQIATEKETSSADDSGSAHILIIEDDDIVSHVMKRVLSPTHHVMLAQTGQEAIDLAQKHRFDLAIVDLGLPDQPGDKVAQILKAEDPKLCTILTTGWSLRDDDPRCTPFDYILPKPADPDQIHRLVNRAIDSLT